MRTSTRPHSNQGSDRSWTARSTLRCTCGVVHQVTGLQHCLACGYSLSPCACSPVQRGQRGVEVDGAHKDAWTAVPSAHRKRPASPPRHSAAREGLQPTMTRQARPCRNAIHAFMHASVSTLGSSQCRAAITLDHKRRWRLCGGGCIGSQIISSEAAPRAHGGVLAWTRTAATRCMQHLHGQQQQQPPPPLIPHPVCSPQR